MESNQRLMSHTIEIEDVGVRVPCRWEKGAPFHLHENGYIASHSKQLVQNDLEGTKVYMESIWCHQEQKLDEMGPIKNCTVWNLLNYALRKKSPNTDFFPSVFFQYFHSWVPIRRNRGNSGNMPENAEEKSPYWDSFFIVMVVRGPFVRGPTGPFCGPQKTFVPRLKIVPTPVWVNLDPYLDPLHSRNLVWFLRKPGESLRIPTDFSGIPQNL